MAIGPIYCNIAIEKPIINCYISQTDIYIATEKLQLHEIYSYFEQSV